MLRVIRKNPPVIYCFGFTDEPFLERVAHLGGGGDGVVAGLQPRQQLTQVVYGRLEGRQVLQDGQDVPARVQHPALVEGLGEEQESGRSLA